MKCIHCNAELEYCSDCDAFNNYCPSCHGRQTKDMKKSLDRIGQK